jgi:hypothetical protein
MRWRKKMKGCVVHVHVKVQEDMQKKTVSERRGGGESSNNTGSSLAVSPLRLQLRLLPSHVSLGLADEIVEYSPAAVRGRQARPAARAQAVLLADGLQPGFALLR